MSHFHVRISVLKAARAPHRSLAPLIAECFSDGYPTWSWVLQCTKGGPGSRLCNILSFIYRRLILPPMLNSEKGVCVLATDDYSGEIMGGLFIAVPTFDHETPGHVHPDPAETFGLIWSKIWQADEDRKQSAGRQTLVVHRRLVRFLCINACKALLCIRLGPWALRRALRYGKRGKELNRSFALALDKSVAMWRVDHVFVRPRFRQRGVCRKLLQTAVDAADEANACLYLSTSNALQNVPLYKHLGFQVVGAVATSANGTADGDLLDAKQAEQALQTLSAACEDASASDARRQPGGPCPRALLTTALARGGRGAKLPSSLSTPCSTPRGTLWRRPPFGMLVAVAVLAAIGRRVMPAQ